LDLIPPPLGAPFGKGINISSPIIMFNFQIINPPQSFIIKEKIIKTIFNEIQNTENTKQSGILNIVFVSDDKIQELNNTYRKIDTVTDVLSFHYFDDFSKLDKEEIA